MTMSKVIRLKQVRKHQDAAKLFLRILNPDGVTEIDSRSSILVGGSASASNLNAQKMSKSFSRFLLKGAKINNA